MKQAQDATTGAGQRGDAGPGPGAGSGSGVAGDPVGVVERLAVELAGVAGGLAPERLSGGRVRAATAALTVLERQARGLRLVLRKAAADSGEWKARGHRSPAEQVAREEGITVGQAKAEIEASGRLTAMDTARDAVVAGRISPEAATVVAAGAAADPSAEAGLVASAARGDLRATRKRAQEVIARADERSGERAERIRRRRSLRAWVSVDGEGHGTWDIPADAHMRVMAALAPYRKAAFTAPRASGERLTDEQLMADALDMLARDVVLDHHTDTTPHQPPAAAPAAAPTDTAQDGSGTSCAPPGGPTLFDQAEPAADRPPPPTPQPPTPQPPTPGPPSPGPPLAGPTSPGPPLAGPTSPGPPPAGPPPRRHRRAPAQVHVLVDLDALRRGDATDGETCEVHGLGPVPVALVHDMMTDALLRLVVTGTDVTKVATHRRYVPEAVRRALFARDKGQCVACGADRDLELHHYQVDFAKGGQTSYDNLAHLCRRHHALATTCGWTLHRTDDGWDLQPPNGHDPP